MNSGSKPAVTMADTVATNVKLGHTTKRRCCVPNSMVAARRATTMPQVQLATSVADTDKRSSMRSVNSRAQGPLFEYQRASSAAR